MMKVKHECRHALTLTGGYKNRRLGVVAFLLLAAAALTVTGCEDEGPIEEAVDEIDQEGPVEETAEEVGEAAEETADEVEEAADEVEEELDQ